MTDRSGSWRKSSKAPVFVAASHEGAVSGSRRIGLGNRSAKEAGSPATCSAQDVEKVVGRWQPLLAQSPMPSESLSEGLYPKPCRRWSLFGGSVKRFAFDYLKEEDPQAGAGADCSRSFVGKAIKIMVQSTQQEELPGVVSDLTEAGQQTIHME